MLFLRRLFHGFGVLRGILFLRRNVFGSDKSRDGKSSAQ